MPHTWQHLCGVVGSRMYNGQWTWSIFCMCTMVSVNFRKSWTWSVLHITFKHNVNFFLNKCKYKTKRKEKKVPEDNDKLTTHGSVSVISHCKRQTMADKMDFHNN